MIHRQTDARKTICHAATTSKRVTASNKYYNTTQARKSVSKERQLHISLLDHSDNVGVSFVVKNKARRSNESANYFQPKNTQ